MRPAPRYVGFGGLGGGSTVIRMKPFPSFLTPDFTLVILGFPSFFGPVGPTLPVRATGSSAMFCSYWWRAAWALRSWLLRGAARTGIVGRAGDRSRS